eukprot:14644687-Ditylum_brightwellii.AAC.1
MSVTPKYGPAPFPVEIEAKCLATCSGRYGRLDIDRSTAAPKGVGSKPPAGSFSYNISTWGLVLSLKTAGGVRWSMILFAPPMLPASAEHCAAEVGGSVDAVALVSFSSGLSDLIDCAS